MSKLNPGVLVEAKECYMDQLKIHLIPVIYEGFISLYEDAIEACKAEKNYYYIVQFQKFLKNIPTWNQSILDTETNRILKAVPLMMELVAAIFVSTVKILSCVKLKGKNKNIKIIIPTAARFVHSVYINAAEMIYYSPMIIVNHTEVENTDKINYIIDKSIEKTMNKLLPLDSILREYLENVFNEPEPEPEPEDRVLDEDDLDLDSDSDTNSESEESDAESEKQKIQDTKNNDFVNNYDPNSFKEEFNIDKKEDQNFDSSFGSSFNEELPMDVGPPVNNDAIMNTDFNLPNTSNDVPFVSDPSVSDLSESDPFDTNAITSNAITSNAITSNATTSDPFISDITPVVPDPISNISDPFSSDIKVESIDPFAESNDTRVVGFGDTSGGNTDDSFFKSVV